MQVKLNGSKIKCTKCIYYILRCCGSFVNNDSIAGTHQFYLMTFFIFIFFGFNKHTVKLLHGHLFHDLDNGPMYYSKLTKILQYLGWGVDVKLQWLLLSRCTRHCSSDCCTLKTSPKCTVFLHSVFRYTVPLNYQRKRYFLFSFSLALPLHLPHVFKSFSGLDTVLANRPTAL